MNINRKQQCFIDEYLIDLNATQAAIRAGYSEPGACGMGYKNLNKPKIQAAITKAQLARSKRTKIDHDYVLTMLGNDVTADVADLYSDEGSLKPVSEWPLVWRQGLVSGIDTQQEYAYIDGEKIPDGIVTKIRLADRTKLKEMLGNHVDVQAFKQQVNATPAEVRIVINRPNGD